MEFGPGRALFDRFCAGEPVDGGGSYEAGGDRYALRLDLADGIPAAIVLDQAARASVDAA
jgi:hypothetical protein